MPFELLTTAPKTEDFTPLSEHQSQTPATFFGSRPVLHCHAPSAKLAARQSEYSQNELLQQLGPEPTSETEEVVFEVDTWVTSKNVILFSTSKSKGLSIGYPTIALHALGTQDGQAAVYLQLDLHDQELTNDDDDIQTLTLHLIPQATTQESTNGHSEETTNGASSSSSSQPPNSTAAKALFEALSSCADLNPDPMDEDEDGEGGDSSIMQMPEPGAGGWITSENMHEFMDEDGNWIGPEIPVLGAGAGQVRSREEDEEGDGDGDGDETKWQRTG